MVAAEQRECAALFRSVSGEEWQRETLCTEWTVRDMLSHIASAVTTDPAHLMRAIRLRNDIHRLNQAVIDTWSGRDPGRLIDTMERHRVAGIGQRILGPGYSLRAMLIHQQDVRRPLGRRRCAGVRGSIPALRAEGSDLLTLPLRPGLDEDALTGAVQRGVDRRPLELLGHAHGARRPAGGSLMARPAGSIM